MSCLKSHLVCNSNEETNMILNFTVNVLILSLPIYVLSSITVSP